jgi:membrane protease YdiL (CAAX protease family)
VPDRDIVEPSALAEPAMKPPRWGLGDVAVGLLLALVGGSITFSLAVSLSGDEADELGLAWVNIAQIGMWAALVGVPAWAAWSKGNGMVRDFGLRVKDWDVPKGAIVGLASQAVLLPLVYLPIFLLTDADSDDLSERATDLADRADGAFGVVMLVLLTGIAAPIIEEIFYRGLFLRALERRWGSTAAIVISGLVFGIIHFSVISTPGLAVFGMVLAVLAVKTGRLGAPIAAHMAFNLLAVVNVLMET